MRFLGIFLLLMNVAFAQDFYGLKDKSINGNNFKMDELKGKVVMVVNLASQCGFTPQIEKLEELYKRYRTSNFVILGVPTNDFGGQTPEDDKGFEAFCNKNYHVTFPLLVKNTVTGPKKRDLYKFLTEKTSKEFQGPIKWNFEKFLIDKTGKVVGRFESSVDPLDKKITSKIETLTK